MTDDPFASTSIAVRIDADRHQAAKRAKATIEVVAFYRFDGGRITAIDELTHVLEGRAGDEELGSMPSDTTGTVTADGRGSGFDFVGGSRIKPMPEPVSARRRLPGSRAPRHPVAMDPGAACAIGQQGLELALPLGEFDT